MPGTLIKLSQQASGHPWLAFRAKQLWVSPVNIYDFYMSYLSVQSEAKSGSLAPQLDDTWSV